MLRSPVKSKLLPSSYNNVVKSPRGNVVPISPNRGITKSEFLLKSRKVDPVIRDMNSLAPDFLKNRPIKASKQIFELNHKTQNKNPQQLVDANPIKIEEIDKLSWSDDRISNNQNEDVNDLSGFLMQNHDNDNLIIHKHQTISNPLEYYQTFRVKNIEKIDSLAPTQYMVTAGLEEIPNQTFHSEENVEEAKYVNFDKEILEIPEERLESPEHNDNHLDQVIEIEVLQHEFEGLNEHAFEAYERVLVNLEEYENLVQKRKQNHGSFAFISLVLLRKMLRKFNEGCICIENFLKAENLLPQIPQVFAINFNKQIKSLKNWDFQNLDLDLLLNPEGSFSSNISAFSGNLQSLQKILNRAKILYSSMSSSKNFEVPFRVLQDKALKDIYDQENNKKKGVLKSNKDKIEKNVEHSKKCDEDSAKKKPKTNSINISNPLELLKVFMEIKSLMINMMNINYKQNLTEANLKVRLAEKDEVLTEKMERELNHNKAEEVLGFISKVWQVFSDNKEFFVKLETQYIGLLKLMIDRCEAHYFRFFAVYQRLSFSMESLRKLCQLNLEEIKLLELETREILEKSIVKLEFPLGKYWKANERMFISINERREKLLMKVQKLKKETKIMRKSLKNEYFYLLYLQKCDETLSKVSQIHHSLKTFSDVLNIMKDSIPIETLFQKLSDLPPNPENKDIQTLKSLKSQYIQLYQTILPYKNRVSIVRPGFPTFFEIEKESSRQLEVIDLNLRKVNEIIEGKSPEILERVDSEVDSTEKLLQKLRKTFSNEISLRDFAKIVNQNEQLDYELNVKSEAMKRWSKLNGLASEKKHKMLGFIEQISYLVNIFTNGKVLVRIIKLIKPDRVKKLLETLKLNDVFEEGPKEEQMQDWLKEVEYEVEKLERPLEGLVEEMLKKDRFREILISYKEVFKLIWNDYAGNVKKIKEENVGTGDFVGNARKIRGEIVVLLGKKQIAGEIAGIFLPPSQLISIVDNYLKESIDLLGNQANSLRKLSRKKQMITFKEDIDNFKANFLKQGIKAHTDAKLQEMSAKMKEIRNYLKDFKNEVMAQRGNPDNQKSYSLSEVKEVVFTLNVCIKTCLFMISIGGLVELFARRLNEIKIAFQQEEEVAMALSQRIKETANDVFLIRKRLKSTKAFLGTDLENLYTQSLDMIALSTQHLSLLYELLGELAHFDGIFNETGFEINAKSDSFYEGLVLFISFVSNYSAKKKGLIEARQKISEKVTNSELQELAKPLEVVNMAFFKVVEAYNQEFDVEYLKFLEPRLKLITEESILGISKEIVQFTDTFLIRNKDHEIDSGNILLWIKHDVPVITQKIRILMELLDSDLSYKGFCASKAKINKNASKMLEVENIIECRNLVGKEKMRNWETILLTIYNVVNGFLTDKANDNLKTLSKYKDQLFGLKKMNHSANKEMNLINGIEELIKYHFKMNEKV